MESEKSVVLITGCSSGIGESLANEFHKHGYIVYQTARNLRDLDGKESRNLRNLRIDVTKDEQIEAAVNEIIKEEGKIDRLVNNAGYSYFGPMLEVPVDELKKMYDVNIHGVVRMIHHVAPHMIERESGLILNISSISAVVHSIFGGPYCSSKAAISALSNIMRQELRLLGIKVVDIQPGAVLSKFAENAKKKFEGVEYKYFSRYKRNVEVRMMQGQLGAMTSDDLATEIVEKVKDKRGSEIPDLMRLGPKSFKLPFVATFAPTSVYDRIVYKVMEVKDAKMDSLVSCKLLFLVAFFLFCFFFIMKFLFF